MVFNVDVSGDFFRFQVSDNTVRVPNTKSFLTQNIYSDNIRPLTQGNDVIFFGGNFTTDAYDEHFKLMYSKETVNFSKTIRNNTYDSNGDNSIIFQQNNIDALSINTSQEINKICYLDEGATNKRYIRGSARTSQHRHQSKII